MWDIFIVETSGGAPAFRKEIFQLSAFKQVFLFIVLKTDFAALKNQKIPKKSVFIIQQLLKWQTSYRLVMFI